MKKDNDDDNNDEEDKGGDWLAFLRRGRRAMVANIGLGAVEVQRMPWCRGGQHTIFEKKELNKCGFPQILAQGKKLRLKLKIIITKSTMYSFF